MRSMGRRRSPCDPSNTAGVPEAASAPARNRMVVAEFPQFNGANGMENPPMPLPSTVRVVPSSFQEMLMRVRASNSLDVTPETRKLSIWLCPAAREANRAARWERDLSPGRETVPFKEFAGRMVRVIEFHLE